MAHLEAVEATIARLEKPAQCSETERTLKNEYKKITKTVHNKDYLRPCPGAELCMSVLCSHSSSASYATASYAASNHGPAAHAQDVDRHALKLLIETCSKQHELVISERYAKSILEHHRGKIAPALKAIPEDIKSSKCLFELVSTEDKA
jgi:hypothetical protein